MDNNKLEQLILKKSIPDDLAEKLGLTPEEAIEFDEAMSLVETIEMLENDDIDKLIERFYAEIPDDFDAGLKKFMELAQSDPAFISKIIAIQQIIQASDDTLEIAPPPVVEKINVKEIKNEQTSIENDALKEKMKPFYDYIYGTNNKK